MENLNTTPEQSVAPSEPVATPVVTPVAVAEVAPVLAAAAPEMPKHSHRKLAVLISVFAVMAGALGAIGFLKPELITSTVAWVTGSSMHAASTDAKVLVNGEWVETSDPEAELSKSTSVVPAEDSAKEPEAKADGQAEAVLSAMPVPVVEPGSESATATVVESVVEPVVDEASAKPAMPGIPVEEPKAEVAVQEVLLESAETK